MPIAVERSEMDRLASVQGEMPAEDDAGRHDRCKPFGHTEIADCAA